jgi:hypothetical protein
MEFREYGGLSEIDFREVVEALHTWAASHARRREPIIMLMGRTFTPDEFVKEVAEQTEFGRSFLDYVRRQSSIGPTRPRTFIDRAILANKKT